MPTIYARWIWEICLRFGNNLSKMCPFADFNRPKLDVCTNLQKKHCIVEQIFLVLMELLHNAHHIREMDLGDLPDLEIIYPKCANLLILTDQNWTFAPIYRKSTALEAKIGRYRQFTEKALHWRANIFGVNGAPA